MHPAALGLVAFVALQHVAFLYLEMFAWKKPLGRKVFQLSKADAETTAALAMNQGLYNGFLAAGLVWSIVLGEAAHAPDIATFFLACVVVAAAFGAATVSPRILLIQGVPAALGLGVVLLT